MQIRIRFTFFNCQIYITATKIVEMCLSIFEMVKCTNIEHLSFRFEKIIENIRSFLLSASFSVSYFAIISLIIKAYLL